jgi:hypothetical protein
LFIRTEPNIAAKESQLPGAFAFDVCSRDFQVALNAI